MDANSGNIGGGAARVDAEGTGGGGADTGPLAALPQSDPAKTTYIPPELRPSGADSTYAGYASYDGAGQGSAPPPTMQASSQPSAHASSQAYSQDTQDKKDNRSKHTPILFPLLLIGAGIIFLLNNTGVLPWNVWGQLWKLWPLILIAIGLEILIGRRNPLLSFIIVLVTLVIGAGIIYWGGGFSWSSNTVQVPLSVPLGAAKAASVSIDMGAGNLKVDGDAASEMLASGTLEYYEHGSQPEQLVTTVGGKANLTLDQRSDHVWGNWGDNDGIDWDVHLDPQLPMSMKVNTDAGNNTLDLTEMKVNNLDLKADVGDTEITMPAAAGIVEATVKGGVGNLTVNIPEGVAARINVNTGIGNVDVESNFTELGNDTYESEDYSNAENKVNLTLNAGVGDVEIKSK